MQNSGLYYKQLCEELTQRIKLLEAMLSKKKKKKKSKLDPVGKEDEDIDNDGKPNTSRDKYLKNRRETIGQEMKNKKKTINEGTVVTDGYIFYGGFPKILNESKKGLPPEMLANLFVTNSTEGYEPEDAAMYPPLPPEIHGQILPHVEDEVLMIGQGGRVPAGANIKKHINDLTTAIGILDRSGHGNHPAAHFLDRIRDSISLMEAAPASVFRGTGAGQQAFSDLELEDQMRRFKKSSIFKSYSDDEQSQEYKDAKAELARRRGEQRGPVGYPSAVPTRTEVQRTQKVADETGLPTALPTNTRPGTMSMMDMDGNPIAVQPNARKLSAADFNQIASVNQQAMDVVYDDGGDYIYGGDGYAQSPARWRERYSTNYEKPQPGSNRVRQPKRRGKKN